MGGWMTYQRMRQRNGLMFRKPDEDPDPYWRAYIGPDGPSQRTLTEQGMLLGDLNRMERDYLIGDDQQQHTQNAGPDPAVECARAVGLSVDEVRRVLRHVFLEQL